MNYKMRLCDLLLCECVILLLLGEVDKLNILLLFVVSFAFESINLHTLKYRRWPQVEWDHLWSNNKYPASRILASAASLNGDQSVYICVK